MLAAFGTDSIASLKAFIERSQEDNKLREELRVKLKTCAPPIFLSKLTVAVGVKSKQLWSFGGPCAVADTPLKTGEVAPGEPLLSEPLPEAVAVSDATRQHTMTQCDT